MSTSAIIVMVVSIVLLWGGAIAAIVQISRHPDTQRQDAEEAGGAEPQDAPHDTR